MVRRLNQVLQLVRDAAVTLASVVIIGTSWGRWTEEPVFLVLDSLSAAFIVLSLINVVLIARKTKGRAFFIGNAVYQLFPGFLLAGILLPVGIIVLALNIAVLATIGVKKSPEELLKHPPIPITRNYRIVIGAGLLVMLASLFMPWFSTSDASASIFGVYVGILTHSNLPGLSISQAAVIFALLALVLPVPSLVCGAFGMVRRRLSLVSGVLAIVAGAGVVVAISGSTGFGAYGFAGGGALVLVGYFAFRRVG